MRCRWGEGGDEEIRKGRGKPRKAERKGKAGSKVSLVHDDPDASFW